MIGFSGMAEEGKEEFEEVDMNEHMLSFSGIDRVWSSIMTRTTNTPHRIHKRYLPVQLLVTYFAQHSIHAPTQRVLPQSQQHQTGHIRQSHPEPTLVAPILKNYTGSLLQIIAAQQIPL